jgi:hypothetical protein
MKSSYLQKPVRGLALGVCLSVVAIGLVVPASLRAEGEERFTSPEDAVKALTLAVEARDTNEMHRIFGPAGHELASPDVVQKSAEFQAFADRLKNKVDVVKESDSKIELQLGADDWPFAIPLIQRDGKWYFDTAAGKEEILNRRIGMNELGAIAVCRSYIDAQHEYGAVAHNDKDVVEYAQHLRSEPNTHNGLYWHVEAGQRLSPFGPLISEAHAEGYRKETRIMTDEQSPYHGYYFKILTRQGRHAPGGKYNYVINGHMVAGYAMVAWPAEWGNTGVMTFMVNQDGKVFQKNIGPDTAKRAPAISTFDPDSSWSAVK